MGRGIAMTKFMEIDLYPCNALWRPCSHEGLSQCDACKEMYGQGIPNYPVPATIGYQIGKRDWSWYSK